MGKPKVRGGRSGNGDRPGSREFWIYRASRRAAHGAAALVVAAGAMVGVAVLEQDDDAVLVLDAPAEGALGRDGVGVWTFDGSAGTTVSVHVDASDFDAVAHLWSPTGELVGTADEGGAMMGMAPDGPLVTDLPLPGRYRIEVRSVDDDGRGDYAVAVRTVRKLPPNVPVTGGTGDGRGWSLPVEVWTFDGTAGHRVHVNAITPIISLRSPLGEQVVVDRDHDLFGMDWWTAVLPSTGEYQIRVHPFGSPSYEIMMRTSGGDSGAGQVENDDAQLPYAPELGRAWSATHGDENGWTDLHYAAVLNRPDLARRLLDAGASMEARLVDDNNLLSERLKETLSAFSFRLGVFALWKACSIGRVWDASPMDLAIAHRASDVAELLLNWGASLPAEWPACYGGVPAGTPLHDAVASGSVELVEGLLNRGAHLEASGQEIAMSAGRRDGLPPLWYANSVEMMELLLDRGANLYFVPWDSGDTLLHRVAWRDDSELVELLLNRGMSVDAVNNDGGTPLHSAVFRASAESVGLLLNRGADVNAVANDGETPLHIAVHRASGEASTPLDLELVELLLNWDASIEAVNDNGETPLDVATSSEVIDLLSNR